jgi:NTE family protein
MSIPVYFRAIFIPDKSVDEQGAIKGNPGIDKEVDAGRDVFVDGGVLDNYPIQIFDWAPYSLNRLDGEIIEEVPGRKPSAYNKSTLGFRVDSQTELNIGQIDTDRDEFKAKNFFQYLLGLTDLIHQMANKRHLADHDWHRTIRINTLDVGATEFSLSDSTQDILIKKGREATHNYFSKYNKELLNYVA